MNDYYRTPFFILKEDYKKIIEVAQNMASKVVIMNIPDSFWKNARPFDQKVYDYDLFCRDRQRLNRYLGELCVSTNCRLFDMEKLFQGHTAKVRSDEAGWYQRDSIHPNTCGVLAIEVCLRQLLQGRFIKPPSTSDERLQYSEREVTRRSSIMKENYDMTKRGMKTSKRPRRD